MRQMTRIKRLSLLSASVAMWGLSSLAGACVDSLQTGHWCMVPSSRLDGAEAKPPVITQSHYDSIQGNAGVRGVMQKWSGGGYDTLRDRLVVWGGGHMGYGGNEVYAFDVNALSWERLTLPSQGPFDRDILNDGTPGSRHTYDGVEYIPPPIDRLYARGGGYYPTGNDSRTTWLFDFNANSWERKANFPESSPGNIAAYDPTTGLMYEQGVNYLNVYNPATNVWQQASGHYEYYQDGGTLALDPTRRKLVRVGRGVVHVWDLTQSPVVRTDLATSGASEIVGRDAPGLVYDPVSDRLVAWSGGTDVYTLNLDTAIWTKHAAAAGNAVTPTPVTAEGGTYGRFRYIPSKNAFIAVNATDENVYFYKLSPTTGIAPPHKPAKPGIEFK